MKVQIGQNYMVIDGVLYDFTSYRDMNVYALLSVINAVDNSRFPDELSEEKDEEIITDEEIFTTPYGYAVLKILKSYYDFTSEFGNDDYKQLSKILMHSEEKIKKRNSDKTVVYKG